MFQRAKSVLKRTLGSVGWDLRRLSPASNPAAQLVAAMEHIQADTVFDIGANTGQFAEELRSVGFAGTIISFDPLSAAHAQLVTASARDPAWVVHPRCAVGDEDGEIEINIAGNSVSSSVLPMLDAHSSAAAGSAYISSERTPLVRLDSVAGQYLMPIIGLSKK